MLAIFEVSDADWERLVNGWKEISADGEKAARVFYDHLFDENPQYRQMFPKDMAAQYVKFVSTIGFLIDYAAMPDIFAAEAMGLGRAHARLGFNASDYDAVGVALLETMRTLLGPDKFTRADADTWLKLYNTLAQMMQAAAKPRI